MHKTHKLESKKKKKWSSGETETETGKKRGVIMGNQRETETGSFNNLQDRVGHSVWASQDLLWRLQGNREKRLETECSIRSGENGKMETEWSTRSLWFLEKRK